MLDAKKTTIRAISGSVYVILIVLACWLGDLGVTLLAGLFAAIGISEFRKMLLHESSSQGIGLYDIMGGLSLAFAPLPAATIPYPFFIVWLIWLVGRMIISIYSKHDHPERVFAVDIAAQIYIAFPMALLVAMAIFLQSSFNTCMPVLSMFILIWVNDTGAFLFGSTFGKHRLFERVSPKKSWEGFWGGMLCSIGIGALIGATHTPLSAIPEETSLLFWIIAGALISIISTFGDLFESVIKRNVHIKDSGNLIPGHGGILDRIDSLLLVIPSMVIFFYIYALISGIF